jgi:hypothetical protein
MEQFNKLLVKHELVFIRKDLFSDIEPVILRSFIS